jgi:hypothetical protein
MRKNKIFEIRISVNYKTFKEISRFLEKREENNKLFKI